METDLCIPLFDRLGKWHNIPWFLLLLAFSLTGRSAEPLSQSIVLTPADPGDVTISWNATIGTGYNLLSATDLEANSWSPLNSQPLVADSTLMTYRDAVGPTSRFYRVVKVSGAGLTPIGISTQTWKASDTWVPANQTWSVSGSTTLISLATWWDGSGTAKLPTDTAGTFVAALNPQWPPTESPFIVQVAYQAGATPGEHVISPDSVGPSGDGFFLLMEAQGVDAIAPIRDMGHTRIWHQLFGPGDPNSILSITVQTDGNSAQVGDLAVAIFGQDNYEDNNQMSLPAGWTSLGFEDSALDNICYRACYKIVTSPGTQSAICSWVDTSCFVAEAAIVVFKAAK